MRRAGRGSVGRVGLEDRRGTMANGGSERAGQERAAIGHSGAGGGGAGGKGRGRGRREGIQVPASLDRSQ